MAMSFFLYFHKVDLVNFQFPNGESDLHQLKMFFLGDKIDLYAIFFIFHAAVVKITFNWVLTMSGRVLVRLGGGVKNNRLCKKREKTFEFKNIQKFIRADKKTVSLLRNFCQLG